jgi:hypothetical protein
MGPQPWRIYAKAKFHIGRGNITLGAGVFKMSLHTPAASAAIMALSTRSTFASIPGEISARGGYVAGGKNLVPATGRWVVGVSAKVHKFTQTTIGLTFTASNSSLNNIKYALIRNSTGPGTGRVLCYVTLSTAAFTLGPHQSLTLPPSPTEGIFTLGDEPPSRTPGTGVLILTGGRGLGP